jgi:hypothetical protein
MQTFLRSRLLSTVLLLGAPGLACAQTTAGAADAPAQAPAPQSAPLTTTPAPVAIKVGVVNPEDLLDYNKTIVIPTAYVTLLTDGKVAAAKRPGMFQQGDNTVRASASYKVQGLDKAFAQQLAKAAQDDLVEQLRKVGFTVLTYAEIKDRELLKNAQRETSTGEMGLPTSSEGSNNFITAAPSDEQYSNSGYKTISAEANVAPGMNLNYAAAHWMGANKVRMMRGAPGVATQHLTINTTEGAGALVKTSDNTPTTANAVSNVLSRLTGLGSIKSVAHEYLMTVDRAVRSFNAEVAKAAAAATP